MILPRQGFKANGRALIALGPLCNVINFGITRSSLFWHPQDPEQVKGFPTPTLDWSKTRGGGGEDADDAGINLLEFKPCFEYDIGLQGDPALSKFIRFDVRKFNETGGKRRL